MKRVPDDRPGAGTSGAGMPGPGMPGVETSDADLIALGRDAIVQESEALRQVAGVLDASFAGAVRLLLGARGRVSPASWRRR